MNDLWHFSENVKKNVTKDARKKGDDHKYGINKKWKQSMSCGWIISSKNMTTNKAAVLYVPVTRKLCWQAFINKIYNQD